MKQSNFISFENLVKGGGIIITITALYWGIINRINLMEAKLDYYITNNESEKQRNNIVIEDLKNDSKESSKELTELRERILEIKAILPKRVQLLDENEKD